LDELFGDRKVFAVHDLPSRIDSFSQKLRDSNFSFSTNEFIYRNTLLPLYRHFLDTSKIAIVYRHMCGHKGGSIHNLLGLMASKIPAIKHLKYCRECNSESINLRGELYFNRLHQLSTVLFCPIHDIPLLSSVINIKQYNRHQFVYPDAKLMRTGLIADYQCVDRKMLITVAKAYKELIECRLDLH